MKNILLMLCLLSTATAFAQIGASRNNQVNEYQFSNRSEHATYSSMAQEQSVLPSSSYFSAQGDRRPSDFAQPEEISLGAIARELRKQHDSVKKSRVVYVNQ